MSTLQYLSSNLALENPTLALISVTAASDLSSCWILLPVRDGILIQNALSRTNLTISHGSANDGIVQELLLGARKSQRRPNPLAGFRF